ncbi:MAG TPA: DinB family protein [Bryobacteraceae bacterium]|nr:DinB family protein [Bryobacteraceae bacterium]
MTAANPDTCRQHLSFMKWADEATLEAVAHHMPESLSGLQHIYLGELVWFRRVVEGQEDVQITQLTAPSDVAGLREAWQDLHRKWMDWASMADFEAIVPHRNLAGDSFRMPAWQTVLHLVNHGSYHRGQVAATLRAAGFAPPATDLIIWYRTFATAVQQSQWI